MLGVMLLLVMLSCHNWILNVLMRLLSAQSPPDVRIQYLYLHVSSVSTNYSYKLLFVACLSNIGSPSIMGKSQQNINMGHKRQYFVKSFLAGTFSSEV